MGDEILSKEETDALLQGIEDGRVETNVPRPCDGEIRPYDLCEEDPIVRGRMPALSRIYERFARDFGASLQELLRHDTEIEAGELQGIKCGDYLQSLPAPSRLELLSAEPLPGSALMVLDPKLVYLAVDAYFGGPATAPDALEPRTFTPGELRVIGMLRDRALEDLAHAWSQVAPLAFVAVGAESSPQFLSFASPAQPVVVSRFEVRFGGGAGELHIAMPAAMLEPVRDRLDGDLRRSAEDRQAAWTAGLRERFEDAELEIGAELVRLEISLRELLRLRPGDVIPVELADALVVTSGGMPLFRARFGASRGANALMMTAGPKPTRKPK